LKINEVWRRFWDTPSVEIRNHLIEHYLPLVRSAAERISTRLPNEVEIDDLASAGQFGLNDAIEGFDPDRGVKFETYCSTRIRGAILDELRAMDWGPRLVRSRSSRVKAVCNRFEAEFGRKPTRDEIIEQLKARDVTEEEALKILKDGSAVSISSLERPRFRSDANREVREVDVISDATQSEPSSLIQSRDLRELLTKGLSRAERLIVVLYYYEQMTMKEIGATLDLSESRVSQMHSSILARLKAQLQHREREFEPMEA
jgi:RNA polymerase sigma factor for flagellar operon FliA